jgi:ABC-type glycerol-3-phosphate transport system permease component
MAAKINKRKEALKHTLLWMMLLLAFFPLYLMVVISFKDNVQFTNNRWFFDSVGTWQWENWAKAWTTVSGYISNSIVVCVTAVALCLVMAIPTAYVLARYRFVGRSVLYYALVGSMFLPGTAATLVATFMLLKTFHLVNSLWALIILGAVGGQIVCVFILRQFIEDIPKELFESARLDGAGHIRQITTIVIPMSGSVLGTLSIMQFIGNWNNLILPLLVLRDNEKLTIPVGLMRLDGEYVKQWGELMAGYSLASIPLVILFIFTMRLFVKGLTAGAIKG